MSEAAISSPPSVATQELLAALCRATGVEIHAEALAEAVGRTACLDEAAASVGLRVRRVVATLDDIGPMARPDLPVVCWAHDGGVWVLDGHVGARFRAYSVEAPGARRWWSRANLLTVLGAGPVHWALVEPVLPAAGLAGKGFSPARRLGGLLWLEHRDGLVVMLYGLVTGLLTLATPLAIQVLINWLAFGALVQPIVLLGGLLLATLGLAAVLRVLQRMVVETIERRIFVRMVADLAARLSRVKASAYDGLHGPELANRFFDVLTLQKATSSLLVDGFTAVLQVFVAMVLLGLYSPWLLVFDLFLLLGIFLVLVPLGVGAERTAIKESKAKYAVAAWIEEIALHPVAMRMNGAGLAEYKADQLARTWLQHRAGHFQVVLRQFAGVQTLQVLMSTAMLVASGVLVLQGQLTIGQLVAAEFILNAALMGVVKFADKLDTVYDLMAGVDKLGALLDLPGEAPVGLGSAAQGPAEVALAGVVLTGLGGGGVIDLSLAPGSRTFVRAMPGTGVGVLAEVVAGLREPSAGTVRRDGVLLNLMRPAARYGPVALVRRGDLVYGSLRENVAMGNPDLDDAAVWRALVDVGLRDRAESLGLAVVIDPSGLPLSSAEQCAVLIARAIVAEPRLLLVDHLLDGLPVADRARLRGLLLRSDAPWTTLIFTSDPRVPADGARHLVLTQEGLDDATS